MPYAEPSAAVIQTAYDDIAARAATEAAAALNPPDAIARLEATLTEGSRRTSALFMSNTSGPWAPENLARLREQATEYAAATLRNLRTCIASGAVIGVPMPTNGRLATLVEEYSVVSPAPATEFAGEEPDQVLIDQFGMPLTQPGVPFLAGGGSEDELVRGSFGVIRAAARLIAAIDDRPLLTED